MRGKSTESKFPPDGSADRADLIALLDFENDVPPLYTPLFGKRLGELVDQATRLPRRRSKRLKPSQHH